MRPYKPLTERLCYIFDPEGLRYEESILELEEWMDSREALIPGPETRWLIQQDLFDTAIIIDQLGPTIGGDHEHIPLAKSAQHLA